MKSDLRGWAQETFSRQSLTWMQTQNWMESVHCDRSKVCYHLRPQKHTTLATGQTVGKSVVSTLSLCVDAMRLYLCHRNLQVLVSADGGEHEV